MDFSFIIPIYNRPDELQDLLTSFTEQHSPSLISYEIIIVEDGSTISSEAVAHSFNLPIRYLTQSNTGPSGARNYGATKAEGEWLIFLDSDTILPKSYMTKLQESLTKTHCDLWGGPDKAREDFTIVQKAINYSMTSFLTTGGIRGKEKSVDKFYPRTFNMGIRTHLFRELGGFRESMRYGEDLDLSMRAIEQGYHSSLLPEVWVYHKRRATFTDFFKQVRHSGRARVTLNKYHPGTLRLVHVLPTLFVVALLLSWTRLGVFILAYALAIVIDVFIKEGSLELAGYTLVAAFVQHIGYGIGFAEQIIKMNKK